MKKLVNSQLLINLADRKNLDKSDF